MLRYRTRRPLWLRLMDWITGPVPRLTAEVVIAAGWVWAMVMILLEVLR